MHIKKKIKTCHYKKQYGGSTKKKKKFNTHLLHDLAIFYLWVCTRKNQNLLIKYLCLLPHFYQMSSQRISFRINRWIYKANMVYINNGIWLKEKGNHVVCRKMSRTGDYATWNKPISPWQISHVYFFSYVEFRTEERRHEIQKGI